MVLGWGAKCIWKGIDYELKQGDLEEWIECTSREGVVNLTVGSRCSSVEGRVYTSFKTRGMSCSAFARLLFLDGSGKKSFTIGRNGSGITRLSTNITKTKQSNYLHK